MKISIISAIGKNNEIGKNNKLLWTIKNDLKHFKKLTDGKIIIMGQKTYESLPIKPLPNRTNIVITDDYDISYKDCIMAYSIKDSIGKALYWSSIDSEIFVIGGGSIYNQFMKYANKLYITKVHEKFEADTFFPQINLNNWELISEENYRKSVYDDYDYSYQIYKRL